MPTGSDLIIDLTVDYVDHAVFDHLWSWCERHRAEGGTVEVHEPDGAWAQHGSTPKHGPRSTRRAVFRRWFAPWSFWQDAEGTGGPNTADRAVVRLTSGVEAFNSEASTFLGGVLAELVSGQRPAVLFITCADSRVVPNVLTSSGPGDLFTIRNIGNVVPSSSSSDHSVAAAIEYAVDRLEVSAIVVCGHSDCGAMHALVQGGVDRESSLGMWLDSAVDDGLRVSGSVPTVADESATSQVDELAHRNVVQQMANLLTYESVRKAVVGGSLRIVGMYFDIATASVKIYDPSTETFSDATFEQ